MGGQASADEVLVVILFFLTCGLLITCITESLLRAIEKKRAELFGDEEDPWGDFHYGPRARRR